MILRETFRWYGPKDPVSLPDIVQCGCEGVFSALHQVPYGEAWTRAAVRARRKEIEAAGLEWTAVESIPVSEEIKTRSGDFKRHIENYKESIRSVGAEGPAIVVYNFMPVLDWVRTDLARKLPDGKECLSYDPVHFAAFEIHVLKRAGAEKDYSLGQRRKAAAYFKALSPKEKKKFERGIIDVFPGMNFGFTIEDVKKMLARYDGIDRKRFKEHYRLFLEQIVPVAEKAGVRLAVHPDDPPWPILGLPRIVSCDEDIRDLLAMVDSPSNGLCFCVGSYSPRAENDLPAMIRRHAPRIHAFHLRSTEREKNGGFYEADHLKGCVDMYEVMKAALEEAHRRKAEGRKDWRIPFRPDHGHRMLDDLKKPAPPNPGYPCIGRMRGLAELRGLELGILRSCFSEQK